MIRTLISKNSKEVVREAIDFTNDFDRMAKSQGIWSEVRNFSNETLLNEIFGGAE